MLHIFRLTRLLFISNLLLAAALFLSVMLAPLVFGGEAIDQPTLLGLFAQDMLVRRTALTAAIGLTVTACIFFRRPSRLPNTKPPAAILGA